MGQASAHSAARANLRVADVVEGLDEHWTRLCGHRRVLGFRLGDGGADDQRPVVPLDPPELGDARDVHQHARPGQPEVEHRDQALTSRQHLGLVAVLGQHRERLVDGRRP